jgi:hypothetical protein
LLNRKTLYYFAFTKANKKGIKNENCVKKYGVKMEKAYSLIDNSARKRYNIEHKERKGKSAPVKAFVLRRNVGFEGSR